MLFRQWKHEFCMRPVPPAREGMDGAGAACPVPSIARGWMSLHHQAKAIMQGVSQHRAVPKPETCPKHLPRGKTSPLPSGGTQFVMLTEQKGSKRTPQTDCVLPPAAAQPSSTVAVG